VRNRRTTLVAIPSSQPIDVITLRAIACISLNSYGFCRNAAMPRPVSS
jgi:hypothetical protein